jgi:hypothetical protein
MSAARAQTTFVMIESSPDNFIPTGHARHRGRPRAPDRRAKPTIGPPGDRGLSRRSIAVLPQPPIRLCELTGRHLR